MAAKYGHIYQCLDVVVLFPSTDTVDQLPVTLVIDGIDSSYGETVVQLVRKKPIHILT